MNQEQRNEFQVTLQTQQAYRVQNPQSQVIITLISGTAEVFGKDLLQNQPETFSSYESFSVFTWNFAQFTVSISLQKEPGYKFNEEEYPYGKMMYQIAKINYILDRSSFISIIRLIGDRPKSFNNWKQVQWKMYIIILFEATLCRTLLNYSFLGGWQPIFIDLDSDQQNLNCPGTLSAQVFQGDDKLRLQHRISYFYGHICKNNKIFVQVSDQKQENACKNLFKVLVQQIGRNTVQKLKSDLTNKQKQKEKYSQQFQTEVHKQNKGDEYQFLQKDNNDKIESKEFMKIMYNQIVHQKEEKSISSSGCIINCPNFQGSHQANLAFMGQIIMDFQISMIIVIDMPDSARELESLMTNTQMQQQNISLIRLEKLRGVSQNLQGPITTEQQIKIFIQRYQVTESVQQDKIRLFQLSQGSAQQIRFERLDQSIVYLVVGVLYLKNSQVNNIYANNSISEDEKEIKINQLILKAPLAFLAYIDCFMNERKSYMMLVPGENYREMLHENVWVSGKLNFVR